MQMQMLLVRNISICIWVFNVRRSNSVFQPQCLLCHTLYRPLAPASAAGRRADGLPDRSHFGVVNSSG
jgi:hypothetical protein